MSGTHEHLEHAEHAEHAAHSPFDKRIAMTIAIVAALLAGVAMLGHKKHNETLFKQGAAIGAKTEAGKYKVEAGKYKVEASNAWAWYQAKRLRQAQYEAYAEMVPLFAAAPNADPQREKVKEYNKELASKKEDEEAYAANENIPRKAEEAEAKAKEYEAKADKEVAKSEKYLLESEHAHHQAEWLDYAHLAVELGLVLCSIAVLTKMKGFWLSGIIISAIGICLVAYALVLLPAHEAHDDHHGDSPGHQQEHKEPGANHDKPDPKAEKHG